MPDQKVTTAYLRLRNALALMLVMSVSLASYQIDGMKQRNLLEKADFVDAFDGAMTAVVDSITHINGIRIAPNGAVAGTQRTKLKRSMPILRDSIDTIHKGTVNGSISENTRRLVESGALDPVGLLEDFLYISEFVVESEALWGLQIERQGVAAQTTATSLLPTMRRIKEIEIDALAEANASLARWGDLTLVLTAVILLSIGFFIFRPMETRVIEAQRDAKRKQKLAEAASEAKSNFLAAMSHEIRTPMNGVLGMTELLRDTAMSGEQRNMVEIIETSGNSLLGIIDDVLDSSRIEAGKLKLEANPFSVKDTATHLVDLLKPIADKSGIGLNLVVEGTLATRHLGDEGRVGQVLTNLVGNAIKFTENGTVTLSVLAEMPMAGMQTIRFSVRDTGIGMTAENLSRIFRQFEQADNSTTRRFGGTGLGLTIAASLIAVMDGEITAESTVGQGSVFHVRINLPVSVIAQPNRFRSRRNVDEGADCAGLRVLVAEDNKANQFVIRKMLESLDCEVIPAENGQVAVERYRTAHPDLVLMDISMPVMDGYNATRAIRMIEDQEQQVRMPVIATSAHVGADHEARCIEAGMDDVLVKPLSLVKLRATLRRYSSDVPIPVPATIFDHERISK